MSYINHVYNIIKTESVGLDAIYEDWIKHAVGTFGLRALLAHGLLEACGMIDGRQLYALVEKSS